MNFCDQAVIILLTCLLTLAPTGLLHEIYSNFFGNALCGNKTYTLFVNAITLPQINHQPHGFSMSADSDNAGSVIFGSGMVENVVVAVGITSPAHSVQKLFLLPVSC